MKITILVNFNSPSLGGTYQFSKAIRAYLESQNAYEADPEKADVYLFNAYLGFKDVLRLKRKYPHKLFIHRIDGPIRLYSHPNDSRDAIIFSLNKHIADATIFQSQWSKQQNFKEGMAEPQQSEVFLNAPNPAIFFPETKPQPTKKIKIIATSWSSFWKKGFKTYAWLDQHLDFTTYEMTFVGKSPISFQNIKHIPPQSSEALAQLLREHDIYLTASEKDPCSNALIEALHCGLPALGLHDGGHPEIIGQAGKTFTTPEEIPALLTQICSKYEQYQSAIQLPSLNQIGESYFNFITTCYRSHSPRKTNLFQYLKMNYHFYYFKAVTSNLNPFK